MQSDVRLTSHEIKPSCMCYDISFTVNIPQLSDYFPDLIFDEQLELEFGPFDHVQAPGVYARHPIIYEPRDDDRLHCRLMEWGIIRYDAQREPDMQTRNAMCNIQSERILNDPGSYWYLIRNRRCLIPVTGTWEHRGIKGWLRKVPYFIRPKDQPLFFLPGLYSVAQIPSKISGETVRRWTFGLITRRPNEPLRLIHNSGQHKHRMSLYLPLSMAKEWVAKSLTVQRYREILDYMMPAEDMEYYTTDTIRTSKQRKDGLPKHAPLEWANLPPLGEMEPDE